MKYLNGREMDPLEEESHFIKNRLPVNESCKGIFSPKESSYQRHSCQQSFSKTTKTELEQNGYRKVKRFAFES
jgi:transposase-like protein